MANTSIERILKDHLTMIAEQNDIERQRQAHKELLSLMEQSPLELGNWKWNREELYDRPVLSGHERPGHAATRPTENDRKCRIARQLVEDTDFGISTQVLQEFYVTAVRKAISGPSPQQIMLWSDRLLQLPTISIDPPLVVRAIAIAQRFQLSY